MVEETTLATTITSKKIACPKCNETNHEIIKYSDTLDFRGMELDVEGLEETKCHQCGHVWTTASQHNANMALTRAQYGIQRDKIRRVEGLLAGTEIAGIRMKLGLSQREAATLFGGGFNAFNKYESGEVLQSYAMDRLLRLAFAVGQPAVDFLKNVFEPPAFFVVSTNTPNEVRITVGSGHPYPAPQPKIRGNSELTKFDTLTNENLLHSQTKTENTPKFSVYSL